MLRYSLSKEITKNDKSVKGLKRNKDIKVF